MSFLWQNQHANFHVLMRMYRRIQLVLMMVALGILGCAPSVYFDKSPSARFTAYKTYAFLPKVDTSAVSIYDSGIIDELIHKSIVAELNARGYAIDTSQPDLLVKFHMMVEEKVETVNSPTYNYPPFGYGYPMRYPYFYYPGPIYRDNYFRTIYYKEGTLIIDLIERSNGNLIWRGWSITDLDNLSKFEQHLPELIQRIMANYPISPGKF